MKNPVYKQIASRLEAMKNCEKSGNDEWYHKHDEALDAIESNHLPSGSGIDSGTTIDRDKTNHNKVVLNSSYHCMNQDGYYDGWIDFTVTVKPHLYFDIDLTISGQFSARDGKYADLKDYLHEVFDTALREVVTV